MTAPRRRGRRDQGREAAEFNPGALVQLVIDSLYDRHGIRVASANVATAVTAAADLLRALHVESTAAPRVNAR
jgi:hypothetical protein